MPKPPPRPLRRTVYTVVSSGGYHRVYQATQGQTGTSVLVIGFNSRKVADQVADAMNTAYAIGLAHGTNGARELAEYIHQGEYTFPEITVDAVETGQLYRQVRP